MAPLFYLPHTVFVAEHVGSTMPRVATLIVLGVLAGAILAQARFTPSAHRQI